MNRKPIVRRLLPATLLVMGAAVLYVATGHSQADNLPATPAAAGPTLAQAITVPSAKYNLSFMEPGIVREMLVKPYDVVQLDQVLATEDADLEEAQLKSIKIEADSTLQIDGAIKDCEAKKVHYEALKDAAEHGGANPQELKEAELDYEVAKIKIDFAREEHQTKIADMEKQQKKIEKMKLHSPVKGKAIVEKVNVQPGEAVDAGKADGAITLVVNTPLWVEMHLPTRQSAGLKVGDTLSLTYAEDAAAAPLSGKVIFKDPIADAASGTQTVRLELANDQEKPAGLLVNVTIPAAVESH